MWERFIKAQEYRAYCMAIQQLRTLGHYNAANEIADYKHMMYKEVEQFILKNPIVTVMITLVLFADAAGGFRSTLYRTPELIFYARPN